MSEDLDESLAYKALVEDTFNKRSEQYDNNDTLHPPLCQHLVQLAQISAGDSVLDVATGTGTAAFAAADCAGPNGWVMGIDLSDAMLDKARAKLKALDSGRQSVLEFLCRDAEFAEFPANTFSSVLCSNGMAYLGDVRSAVARIHRWLRPGGTFAFNNPQAPMFPLSGIIADICQTRFGVEVPDPAATLGAPERIRTVLTAAMYCDIEVTQTQEHDVRCDMCPEEYAERIFRVTETFPSAPLAQLTSDQVAELKALYMPPAMEMAKAYRHGNDIHAPYTMLWGIAKKQE
eukprot:CAMPEP_0206144456 /NCGR_PEP_ID=MMETSP1473-20131121/24156_1 /ASSEMBLY_ACC=CAM_ASM_001109 /TAXON_ID=1461547 /ORGANISM="Stichococcus sp, Strain RCC1054" /LENGTH=288 /DNA_ID=CAMNT_0053540279 /DNA_START=439 /DNA_END=1305 /DNA_ORIENTATION=-